MCPSKSLLRSQYPNPGSVFVESIETTGEAQLSPTNSRGAPSLVERAEQLHTLNKLECRKGSTDGDKMCF